MTPTAPTAKPASPAKRQKIQMIEVVVAQVDQETPDTVTLWLDRADKSDGEGWSYKAGQFLTVRPTEFPALSEQVKYFEHVKGIRREPARAYSLASAPHEPYVGISVKIERFWADDDLYPPLLSPYLVSSVDVGARFEIQGFGGPYVYPDDVEETTDHIVHLCSGSGIVPNYALIKDALHRDLDLRHTLIFGNKTWADVIYQKQLAAIAEEHPDRVQIVHAITREDDVSGYPGDVRKGRVDRTLIEALVPDTSRAQFYICGAGITKWQRKAAKERGEDPKPLFVEGALANLEAMGVDKSRVHRESW